MYESFHLRDFSTDGTSFTNLSANQQDLASYLSRNLWTTTFAKLGEKTHLSTNSTQSFIDGNIAQRQHSHFSPSWARILALPRIFHLYSLVLGQQRLKSSPSSAQANYFTNAAEQTPDLRPTKKTFLGYFLSDQDGISKPVATFRVIG